MVEWKGIHAGKKQQFGPQLRAGTPNLAKRMIVRVAGYEEEVKGDFEQNSLVRMQERQGRAEVQSTQRTLNTDQQQDQSNGYGQGDLVLVQEVQTE